MGPTSLLGLTVSNGSNPPGKEGGCQSLGTIMKKWEAGRGGEETKVVCFGDTNAGKPGRGGKGGVKIKRPFFFAKRLPESKKRRPWVVRKKKNAQGGALSRRTKWHWKKKKKSKKESTRTRPLSGP